MLISKLECTKIIIIVFFQPILQDSGVLIIIKTWSKYRTNIITGGEGSALFKKKLLHQYTGVSSTKIKY